MVMYLQININRTHFSGGKRTKAIMLFPMKEKEDIPAILEKMGHEFCTYLSEFNKNLYEEHDYKVRKLTEEVIDFDLSEEDAYDTIAKYTHEILPAKSLYLTGMINPYLVMQKVNYCITLEINPPLRDIHPKSVYLMTISKTRDPEYTDSLRGKKFGVYILV